MEAATILSTACPAVFSIKNLHKKHPGLLSSLSSSSLSSSSDILPASPVLNESNFLIEEPPPDRNPTFPFKFNPVIPVVKSGIAVREGSPPGSPKYDVDSIFGDEVVEGIDSIMGKLSVNDCDSDCNPNINPYVNPFVGSPMGIGGKFGLGRGLGQWGNKFRQVLRGEHNEDLWRQMPMVQMNDIVPKFNPLPSLEKKQTMKKMKKAKEVMKDESKIIISRAAANITACPSKLDGHLKSGLGLKLNHEEVIEAWGDQGFPISSDSGALESSADIAVRLAEIDLVPDNEGGGTREASVLRYREKRKTRLFSNKIRYQVRKVNADCKPRMKGRFVKQNHFLQEMVEEESQ